MADDAWTSARPKILAMLTPLDDSSSRLELPIEPSGCRTTVKTSESSRALGASVSMMSKKAVDPIAILVLFLGGFAATGIAQGFFARLGEDLYPVIRRRLASLVARRAKALVEFVLIAILPSGAPTEVVIIMEITGRHREMPEPVAVLAALEKELPRSLRKLVDREPHRVVYSWERRRLRLLHILNRHGVPIIVRSIPSIKDAMRSGSADPGTVFAIDEAACQWRQFDIVPGDAGAWRGVDRLSKESDEHER